MAQLNITQFEQLIGNLMSADNNVRGQSEQIFNETKKTPDVLLLSLTQLVRTSQHEAIRKLSTILIRRVLSKADDSLWPLISPQTQEALKTQLLQAVQSEQAEQVRDALSDTVAHIGAIVMEKGGQWSELLPFLFNCVKSEDTLHREAALNIFSDLANHIGDKLRPFFNVLKDVFAAGLNDKSLKVRLAALDAATNFLHELDQPHERQQFQQLTPLMLNTIGSALNEKSEEDARSAIEVFVDMSEIDPTFLRPHLAMVITAMLQMATHPHLESETKNLALECLITLAENKPSMIRKYPKFLESVLPIVLNLMVKLDDDQTEWNMAKDDDDDEVDIQESDIGEESLDRLSLSLGGKLMVPVLFSLLPSLLQNSDWKYRHAGLMAISIIGEGSHRIISPNLAEIVKTIVPFFRDPHPRVRWAVCNTIGQMSTDFGPEFQAHYHSSIIPALISVMDDKDNPRVQSHAASAIINFCENCKAQFLTPYLEQLLTKLFMLLQHGQTVVQEQAITAIAAIADCVEAEFAKYYDSFMPMLKTVLANANGKDYRLLRGKAMECISLIGVAVGKDKFVVDAKEIMDLMLKAQSTNLESDDPQVSFLFQSWARLCRCLGSDFVPYLPHVMPPLLHSAKITPDVKISDVAEEQPTNDEGWDFIPVGDKRIGIHTSGLEEKSTACNMLFCYASELKEGFFPFVEDVAKVLVPLVKFYYHDGVRSAAFTTMPHLLISASEYLKKNAAKGADATYVRNLFHFMYQPMVDSLKEEIDMDILVTNLSAFTECLTVSGEGCLSAEQVDLGVQMVLDVLEEVKERRQERQEKRTEEDHDEEEEEKIEDEGERDDEIVSGLGEVLGHYARYHKAVFLPIFSQKLLAVVLELLKPNSKTSDRQSALCIFDDIVEHCGHDSIQFFSHFVPTAINYITDADPSVRQAALYGMGWLAQVGGDHIAPAIPDILNRMVSVITAGDARDARYVMATENGIGALGKILLYQSKVVDVAKVIPLWLSWFPVKEDVIESRITYKTFLTFVESNNPHMLGADLRNLGLILSVFAEILETDLIDDEIHQRIKILLRNMQTSLPSEVLQKTWASLNPVHQQKLHKAVSN